MGWFGPTGDCGCGCEECPIEWFQWDCYLYWRIKPGFIPAEPYEVRIVTADLEELLYDSVSGAVYIEPTQGTYFATLNGGQTCMGEYLDFPCNKPCCARVTGINTRLTNNPTTLKRTGLQFIPGPNVFAGGYMECTMPDFNYYDLREGIMSSGTKADDGCYDLWGLPTFLSTEDIPMGSGHVTAWTGLRGYESGGPVACSIPTNDFWYQRIYYDYFLRYRVDTFDGHVLELWGTRTSEDFSSAGSPRDSAPSAPTLPSNQLLGKVPFEPCPSYPEMITVEQVDIHLLLSHANYFAANGVTCEGSLDAVFEQWPDVAPL